MKIDLVRNLNRNQTNGPVVCTTNNNLKTRELFICTHIQCS